MKIFYVFLLTVLFALQLKAAYPQQIKFNRVTKNIVQATAYMGIAQDKQGFIWTIAVPGGGTQAALYRYDDPGFKVYESDPQKPNTLQNSIPTCIFIDDANQIWIGHFGGGLDRFDPLTEKFANIRHNAKDATSLSSDTVYCVLQDHNGNLWVGTKNGLNLMDKNTGKFTRFLHNNHNPKSISSNIISYIYEDRKGELWAGCSDAVFSPSPAAYAGGGLNLFHPKTNTFTSYLHNPADSSTLSNNEVCCIYEDNKSNFWVGTQGNGLQTLDRKTGKFTHYPYDAAHPEKLGSFPRGKEYNMDHINFICGDVKEGLWIGMSADGLYRYNPATKKLSHYGSFFLDQKIIYKDTSGGVIQHLFLHGFNSKEGMFWAIAGVPAAIYSVNFTNATIPFVPLNANGNAFCLEPGSNTVWIGTNKGLIRKDRGNNTEKVWTKDNPNNSGWAHDTVGNMTRDKDGIIWIATLGGGLCRFDPVANKAVYYLHDKNNPNSISSNKARNLLIDHNNNIWVATWGAGLDMLDTKTGKFIHYVNTKDSASLCNDIPDHIYEDKDDNIWVGSFGGLDRLNKDGKTFSNYLIKNATLNVYTDHTGTLWAGGYHGLSYYNKAKDKFLPFNDPSTNEHLGQVTDIQEDSYNNLWLRTTLNIVKINEKRTQTNVYGQSWGVYENNIWISRSLKGNNGELFFGTINGYFDFYPEKIASVLPPHIAITGFLLNDGDKEDVKDSLVNYDTREIELSHDQNSFSFDFIALHYDSPGIETYQVKLENYDHTWRDRGADHKIPFFDVPPGKYVLRIKAFNADGALAERDLAIIIDPPWWKTWWAYTLFGLAIIGSVWGLIDYRGRKLINENKVLEHKVNQRTDELQRSLKELKATQTQLIQSEKMASLGELTAGIAHEIQNPLNFVNNFSEVSVELLQELKEEAEAGNKDDVIAIATDLTQNLEKIRHHGKRADAIVKGMLQHSQSGGAAKEPTNVNSLADEYLRLSYHGLRSKDKSFNADMVTQFDEKLPQINLVPQDIGRVLLNLFNNAFYAVNQKAKIAGMDYKPEVSVSTSTENGQLIIKVKDNGVGIPDAIKEKIMQPFFTTKPTGEGTGLGLSLTYDMVVKGHGGKIEVNTREGQFTEFIISLPIEN